MRVIALPPTFRPIPDNQIGTVSCLQQCSLGGTGELAHLACVRSNKAQFVTVLPVDSDPHGPPCS